MSATDVRLPTTLRKQRAMRDKKMLSPKMSSQATCPLSIERRDKSHVRNCRKGGECHEPMWDLGWDYCQVFLNDQPKQREGGDKR